MVQTGFSFVLLVVVAASYAYVIDSDHLKNLYDKNLLASRLSADLHRLIRTTKFPRIGRSIVDSDDFSSYFDVKSPDNLNVDDLDWLERRSVLFPRIGKRFYADDQPENSLFNENQPTDSSSSSQYRDKRNVSM